MEATSIARSSQGPAPRELVRLAKMLEPVASPHSRTSMPPTVLGVPDEDYRAFLTHVVSRYLRTLGTHWPRAMLEATREPAPRPPSDAGPSSSRSRRASARSSRPPRARSPRASTCPSR